MLKLGTYPTNGTDDEQQVYKTACQLVSTLQQDYDNKYHGVANYSFELITTGRKYYKIIAKNQGVHAFIDKKTGDVYKPASYKAPAKIVRYNLLDINSCAKLFFSNPDWAGGYLYLR